MTTLKEVRKNHQIGKTAAFRTAKTVSCGSVDEVAKDMPGYRHGPRLQWLVMQIMAPISEKNSVNAIKKPSRNTIS